MSESLIKLREWNLAKDNWRWQNRMTALDAVENTPAPDPTLARVYLREVLPHVSPELLAYCLDDAGEPASDTQRKRINRERNRLRRKFGGPAV